MKVFLLFLLFVASMDGQAFTVRSGEPRFPVNEVVVDISGNDCANAGYTAAQLYGLVKQAVDEYWNQIPTCALELKMGQITGDDISNLDTNASFNLVQDNHILIGCNSEATVIDAAARSSVIAQGTIGAGGGVAAGIVLINDFAETPFDIITDRQRLAALAHEIGHAFGLGHSEYPISLMYYSTGTKLQEHLSIDDFDGCSYLYSNEGPVNCSSIALVPPKNGDDEKGKAPPVWPMFLIGLILALFLGSFMKRKSISF